MTNYVDQVSLRIAKHIPRCALQVTFEADGVIYLHPTKGWKRVSYKRLGIKLTQVDHGTPPVSGS